MKYLRFLPALGYLFLSACNTDQPSDTPSPDIYLGADLSYVNEMEDCGAVFRSNGKATDPFGLFAEKGANLMRVRLWHNPDWTNYSGFEDVKKTIKRAKEADMRVLLDFHYSDTWADPSKQIVPSAWADAESLEVLGDSVYLYTRKVLMDLNDEGLLPELVQVGNETNSEILMPAEVQDGAVINWERNAFLLNKGLQSVRDVAETTGKDIQAMLHIAQPENALWWFAEAKTAGIEDYDWIGLSYYPVWSTYSMSQLASALKQLKNTYGKRLMIVETAYPHTYENADPANNILGSDAVLPGYPVSPEGQRKYIVDLTQRAVEGGAEGVIYWEPAWVSSSCSTLWGQGSHWDNATFFDASNNNEALPAFDFFKLKNYTFK